MPLEGRQQYGTYRLQALRADPVRDLPQLDQCITYLDTVDARSSSSLTLTVTKLLVFLPVSPA